MWMQSDVHFGEVSMSDNMKDVLFFLGCVVFVFIITVCGVKIGDYMLWKSLATM